MHSSRHVRDQWLRRWAETLIRPDKKSLLRRAKQEQDAIIGHVGRSGPLPLLSIDPQLHTASRAQARSNFPDLNPFNTAGIGARADARGCLVVNAIARGVGGVSGRKGMAMRTFL
jgi:hypothetical protein